VIVTSLGAGWHRSIAPTPRGQPRRTGQGYGRRHRGDNRYRAAVTAAIELSGVSKSFGSLEALAGIDLAVAPSEVVTVLGPSGSGKTTLLRLVGALDEPTSGRVTVDGASPHRAREHKRIGFVPQSPALFPWRTVAQNARVLLDVNRRRNDVRGPTTTELLEHVGLASFGDAYPHELSGGMQQRVALVRAVALGAPLLLMDEPFAALDEITRTDMRHLLTQLCEPLATTVLFVTHSIPESVFLSDRVVVLSTRPGRIVGIEPVELPRPRHPELEDTAEFFTVETRLRSLLREGSGR
jgi:NitT/TauT family transport system ATP-binding protein